MEEESNTNQSIKKRKNKAKKLLFSWVEDNYDKLLIAVFILAVILRIYFFWITKNQAVWWDAADYLTQAKVIAGKINIEYIFNPRRPFLLAVLWGFMFKIGLGEISLRVTEVIFSIAAIPAMYFLGKVMFNKKVGLISAFLLAVFWQHLFFTNRLMTEMPSLLFLISAMYFFWQGYVKKHKPMKNMIWFGIFMGLALLTRGGSLLIGPPLALFILTTDKLKFLKNKHLWMSLLIIFLIMSPFFLFIYIQQGGNPVSKYLGFAQGRYTTSKAMGLPGLLTYTGFMPEYFGWALLIPFLLGILILLADIGLNLDIIIKNNNLYLKKLLLLFFWIAFPLLFLSIVNDHFEPRYILFVFPAFFIVLSNGLIKLETWAKKYHKHLGLILIIIILGLGGYYQINRANESITPKINSYKELKLAGEWLKQNTNKDDTIITKSVSQITYYSERQTYPMSMNKTEFEQDIENLNPDYLVLSIFENHAPWMFQYPNQNTSNLVPVKAYQQQEQPVLVIYRFNNNNTQFNQYIL